METCPNFPGADELIHRLDQAVADREPEEATQGVKETLCHLIQEQAIRLPDRYREPLPDSYARRLVYRSSDHGYMVLAMTWGIGQGTPLHDHAGIWCVEGVVEGLLEVVQYELVEQRGDRYRFRPQGTVLAGPGNAGSLIPPFEYHTLANARTGAPSVTLHVYGGDMTDCSVFIPVEDGWYERRARHLSLDP